MTPSLTVGLISMPWMSPSIPSIQLATLSADLALAGIATEVHELFLDYAATIGVDLYNKLSDAGRFIDEYIFARHYFREETGNALQEFRRHRPRFGLRTREQEDQVLDALDYVTHDFLHNLAAHTNWSRYAALGFSLTISQTAASMALARLIKLRFPELPILFGGSACAGPMGTALLRICPYIDVVVRVEGEGLLPELVRRLAAERPLDDLPGISFRSQEQVVKSTPAGTPVRALDSRPPLQFDAYFARKQRLGLTEVVKTWLPFESSRGCWYGEKQQCTFCGLHEIMEYRGRTWEAVLAELELWSEKYDIQRFFSVDLIMPLSFYETLLPEIQARGHNWSLFYEIKANVRRIHVERLASGGVKWIQPGIESLDSEILKLMKKGVSAVQNIQLLKWCAEFGIRVTWNIISGIPGERPESYADMAKMIPWLYHLYPPSGASPFQLHRFSPYFDHPEDYGLTSGGANTLYQSIFPVPQADLDDLVYHHTYTLDRPEPLEVYTRSVVEAISAWQKAFQRPARLELSDVSDGGAWILDTRASVDPVHYRLTAAEFCFYRYLEEAKPEKTGWTQFVAEQPQAADEIEQVGSVHALLATWEEHGLIIRCDGKLLALAIRYDDRAVRGREHYEALASPIPYLSQTDASTS